MRRIKEYAREKKNDFQNGKSGKEIAFEVISRFIELVTMWFCRGYFVSLLWNLLIVSLFGVPAITFWEGLGLIALVNLLIRLPGED